MILALIYFALFSVASYGLGFFKEIKDPVSKRIIICFIIAISFVASFFSFGPSKPGVGEQQNISSFTFVRQQESARSLLASSKTIETHYEYIPLMDGYEGQVTELSNNPNINAIKVYYDQVEGTMYIISYKIAFPKEWQKWIFLFPDPTTPKLYEIHLPVGYVIPERIITVNN